MAKKKSWIAMDESGHACHLVVLLQYCIFFVFFLYFRSLFIPQLNKPQPDEEEEKERLVLGPGT